LFNLRQNKKGVLMKIVLFLVAVLTMTSAFASPPQPISNVLHFSDMLQMWQAGQKTTDQILTGKWLWVASSYSASCGYNGEDSYEPTGIKTSDGAVTILQFGYEPLNGNIFTGSPTSQIFTVRRSDEQGPFRVNPQEPQFSFWAYMHDGDVGTLSKLAYFNYSCRLMNGSTSRMVCAATQILNHSPEIFSDEAIACADDKPGFIDGFVKIQ
jgi:hypothetical protein